MVALLGVVLVLGVVHAGQPLHLHHGTTAGLYNEEHVLAALDSVAGDAPLPESPTAIPSGVPAGPTAPASDAWLLGPAARHTDPRAPPVA